MEECFWRTCLYLSSVDRAGELLKFDLGRRMRRPFLTLGKYTFGNSLIAVFLTAQERKGRPSVNIDKCDKSKCKDFHWKERAYVYENRGRRYLLIPVEFLKDDDAFKFCGYCSIDNSEEVRKWARVRG